MSSYSAAKSPSATNGRTPGLAPVRIGVERLADPACLALLAARAWQLAVPHGIDLQLIEHPRGEGVPSLAAGDCDLLAIGRLQQPEMDADGLESLGCMFESRGGVLFREERLGKLRDGDRIRVAASFATPASDRMCRLVLQSWAGLQGFAMAETQVMVEPAAAGLVTALQAGYDAVWLASVNAEEVAARLSGLSVLLITADDLGFPNLATRELLARRRRTPAEAARHQEVVAILQEGAQRLQADPDAAVAVWAQATGETGETAAAVIRASIAYLKARIEPATGYWRPVPELLEDA